MDNLQSIFERQQRQKQGIQDLNTNVYDVTEEEMFQIIGFIIGSEEYAVPILNVVEIVKPIEYTRVPGTPPYVLGVFNMRGNVYPLINLRLKFGMQPIKQDKDTRYLVMKQDDNIAGFVIDKLTSAITLPYSAIDPAPATLANSKNGVINGIGKLEDHLITILNVDALLRKDF